MGRTELMMRIDLGNGDLDSGGELDDLSIDGELIKMLRIERMSHDGIWARIYMKDGRDFVVSWGIQKRTVSVLIHQE